MNVLQKTSLSVFLTCYSQLFLNKVKSLISHQRDQPCEDRHPAWLESWWGPLECELMCHSDPFQRHRDGWDLISFCMESPLVWVRQTVTEGCSQSHWSCYHYQASAAFFQQQLHLCPVGWKGMLSASQLHKQIYYLKPLVKCWSGLFSCAIRASSWVAALSPNSSFMAGSCCQMETESKL